MPTGRATTPAHTNALIDQTSPYLLQHAHNPVDWRPWGNEAFAEAKRRDVPIFLSIGYATCYWCHVMERQVFENAALAKPLNERFVCIKVDREQHPDVDELYMAATQLITRRGGWPMSVFLLPPTEGDPGLRPFWAGTYIPPEPVQGLPGFRQVLDGIADAWQNKREQVFEQARQVAAAVGEHLAGAVEPGDLSASIIQDAAGQLLHTYDPEHGGFGQAPKFPQPTNLFFLLAVYRNNPVDQVRAAITHTLDRMATGGVFDQVGGGFHRYSTDAKWLVPHFEKMLYDNGQLLEAYAAAYEQLGEGEGGENTEAQRQRYARVMRETAEYVMREMTDGTGAFWSAQDAEVNAREGENYLWTPEQVSESLGDEKLTGLASRMYGLDDEPNFRDPHDPHAKPTHVLHLPRPLAQWAGEVDGGLDALLERRQVINAALKATRDQRDQPATDDKVLTGWNGLMIAGLAKAGRMLGEAKYVEAGARAADAVLQHLADPNGGEGALLRMRRDGRATIPALLEDYAMLAHGLIELYRAQPQQESYLDKAVVCVNAAIERFAAEREGRGGYYDTPPGRDDLFVRVRGISDGAVPGGNSVMAHNLLDLHELTGERAWLDRAAADLRSFAAPLGRMPLGMVHMAHAVLRLLEADPALASAADTAGAETEGRTAAAPSQADPVTITLDPPRLAPLTEPTDATLTLTIAKGLHIIASDAITIEPIDPAAYDVQVTWPDPVPRRSPLTDEEASVYEGRIQIPLRLSPMTASDAAPRLRLRYQACSQTECHPPRVLELPAP